MEKCEIEGFVGDFDAFLQDYWGKRPRLHTSADRDYLTALLTLGEADAILASPSLRPPYLEMTKGGLAVREKIWTHQVGSKSLVIGDAVNVDVLAAEFSKGATLILNHLDDYHPRNKEVCDLFHAAFGAVTKTVAFITPAAQQGLGTHYDTFEGFIVQTHGSKTWHVYKQVRPLATKPKGYQPGELSGDPILSVTLNPGDCLYIPWGSPHYATSNDDVSAHVTIMVFPLGWSEFLRAVFAGLIPPAAADEVPILRGDRIAELATQLRHHLDAALAGLASVDPVTLARDALSQHRPRPPKRSGFLRQQALRDHLTVDSRVSWTGTETVSITDGDNGHAQVRLARKTFRLPSGALPALAAFENAADTRIGDLDVRVGPATLLSLAQHLIDAGMLRVSP